MSFGGFSRSASQDSQARAREGQTKFIKDSVNKVEKSFSTICGQMGSVNRREGRLRDKYDEMAKYLDGHANMEQGPLKLTFRNFAEHVSAVQDYRQALIDRLDAKVVQPLSAYRTSCKHTQTDLNKMMQSRGREMKTHRQLDQVRNKAPSDTHQIHAKTRAENELQRATLAAERSSQTLEETIDRFENQRVTDIKKIMTDYIQIQMLFHAKALERFTLCYQDLQNLNLEDHIAIFRNSLRPNQLQERINLVQQQMGGDPQQRQNVPVTDIYATPQRRQPAESGQVLEENTYEEESEEGEYSEEEEEQEEESDYETEEEEPEPTRPAVRQQRTRPF